MDFIEARLLYGGGGDRGRGGDTRSQFPPITITDVLPSSHLQSIAGSVGSSDPLALHFPSITPLDVPGFRDANVRRYTEWQQSNFIDEDQKKDYKRACDITLRNGLDLVLISEKSQGT